MSIDLTKKDPVRKSKTSRRRSDPISVFLVVLLGLSATFAAVQLSRSYSYEAVPVQSNQQEAVQIQALTFDEMLEERINQLVEERFSELVADLDLDSAQPLWLRYLSAIILDD